jgi:tetratricopeptide (TPR) repeat protein
MFHWWSGNPEEAEEHFNEGIETNKNYFSLRHGFAEFLASEGRDSEALVHYGEALRLNPTARQVHASIRFLLRRLGQDPDLGKTIERILGHLESSEAKQKRSPLCLKTLALVWIYHPTRKSAPKALECVKELLERTREEGPEALGIAAEVYELAGDLQRAVSSLEKAVPLPGADPTLELRLGSLRETLEHQPVKMEFWIPEGSDWHFFKGREEPRSDWRSLAFDLAGWELGPAPFGFGLDPPRCHTQLTDMAGGYRTIYVRKKFRVDHRARIRRLWLLVRAADGFVAYLNGTEVGRERAGSRGAPVPHDRFADAANPAKDPVRLELDPTGLQEGENCVAIQGLIVDSYQYGFFLDATLVAWVNRQ